VPAEQPAADPAAGRPRPPRRRTPRQDHSVPTLGSPRRSAVQCHAGACGVRCPRRVTEPASGLQQPSPSQLLRPCAQSLRLSLKRQGVHPRRGDGAASIRPRQSPDKHASDDLVEYLRPPDHVARAIAVSRAAPAGSLPSARSAASGGVTRQRTATEPAQIQASAEVPPGVALGGAAAWIRQDRPNASPLILGQQRLPFSLPQGGAAEGMAGLDRVRAEEPSCAPTLSKLLHGRADEHL